MYLARSNILAALYKPNCRALDHTSRPKESPAQLFSPLVKGGYSKFNGAEIRRAIDLDRVSADCKVMQ